LDETQQSLTAAGRVPLGATSNTRGRAAVPCEAHAAIPPEPEIEMSSSRCVAASHRACHYDCGFRHMELQRIGTWDIDRHPSPGPMAQGARAAGHPDGTPRLRPVDAVAPRGAILLFGLVSLGPRQARSSVVHESGGSPVRTCVQWAGSWSGGAEEEGGPVNDAADSSTTSAIDNCVRCSPRVRR
jgi:hypothetical protein